MGLNSSVPLPTIPLPSSPEYDNSDRVVQHFLNQYPNIKIYGPYVYRKLILGKSVKNIHIVKEDLLKGIVKDEVVDNLGRIKEATIEMNGNLEVHLTTEEKFKQSKNTFANVLVLTKDGVHHRHSEGKMSPESPEYQRRQVNFVLSNLKKKRYCYWYGMNSIEEEIFKDFKEISKDKCDANGFKR